jgi:hypothetical protein
MNKYIILLISLLISYSASSNDISEYKAFFKLYEKLGNEFNSKVIDFYLDDAVITSLRRLSDGEEQTFKFKGRNWKELQKRTWELSKKRNDRNYFSNVSVSIDENSGKITATRYSILKCYSDKNYYMKVKKIDNSIYITEEHMESVIESACEEEQKNSVELLLQMVAKIMSDRLPLKIDSESELHSVISDKNTLTYKYRLTRISKNELSESKVDSLNEMAATSLPIEICTDSKRLSLLKKGAVLKFVYLSRDNEVLIKKSIGMNDCK